MSPLLTKSVPPFKLSHEMVTQGDKTLDEKLSIPVKDGLITFLNSSLVRIQSKGPEGFENRPTFNVLDREQVPVQVKVTSSGAARIYQTKNLKVVIPDPSEGLTGVQVYSHENQLIYTYSADTPKPAFLPGPTQPANFVMPDDPRIVPPAWGAVPAPKGNELHPSTSGWDVSNDAPDIYVFAEPNYDKLRTDYLNLTGHTELPPLFTFGFWNSRWFPYSEKSALAEINGYRKRRIPLDLFVLDTNWRVGGSHGYQVDTTLFPDMHRFMDEAHALGVKIMMNDHPEPIAPALSPKELKFRQRGLDSQLANGLNVWWFDRNWSTHLGQPVPGLPLEVWGMRLYHDMTLQFHPNRRPLIMTNAQGIDNGITHYAPNPAAHRYPIWWTGDTQSLFAYLHHAVANCLDQGVKTLCPYINDDLGGHIGPPTPELYIRELEYGCLAPVTRVHCTYKQTRLPWDFGPQAQRIVTRYIRMRYRLLPTIYAAAAKNYATGTPLLQRLDLDYPDAPKTTLHTEFRFGSSLLVAPKLNPLYPVPKPISSKYFKNGLRARFCANPDLQGDPVLQRTDKNIDFDWGYNAVNSKVPQTNMSAVWTGTLGPVPTTGTYTFSVTSDDGARFYIDHKKVLDDWGPQDDTTKTVQVALVAGKKYQIRLDYQQLGGGALCHLGWALPHESEYKPFRKVWIPNGSWTDLWTGKTVMGPKWITASAQLNQCPMWIKSGNMVLLAPQSYTNTAIVQNPITIDAYADVYRSHSTAEFYQDDGISNLYKHGQSATTQVTMTREDNQIYVKIGARQGTFDRINPTQSWILRIHLAPGESIPSGFAQVDGKKVKVNIIDPSNSRRPIVLQGAGAHPPVDGGKVVEMQYTGSPNVSHLIHLVAHK